MRFAIAAAGLLLALGSLAQTGRAAEGSPTLMPLHYELSLDVDYDAEVVDGFAAITLRNLSEEPAPEGSLLLYRLMSVDSVRDAEGRSLELSQRAVQFSDFGKLQVNQIIVRFAETVPPGGEVTLLVEYSGHLLGYVETGMSYTQDHISREFTILRDDTWAFPKPGYPSVTAMRGAPEASFTYRARITVPEELRVVSGGELLAVEKDDGRATFVYESIRPSFRMDFAIGEYATLNEGAVHIHHLAGDERGAAAVARAARRSLDLYTEWFGPLAGENSLTFIEIPDGYGSQTTKGTIIQSAGAFRDTTRNYEVYHEVSHLWNVTATDRPSPRWEEGLAMFLQYLVAEGAGEGYTVDERADRLIAWLRERIPEQPALAETPMLDYGTANLTDASYTAGGLLFDVYYRLVGPDAFRATVGDYYRRYHDTGGSTEDFIRLASGMSPVDLTSFFEDWFYTARWTDRVLESADHTELVESYR